MRRAADCCSTIKVEMRAVKNKAEHDLGEMRAEVHVAENEVDKVRFEAGRKLKVQAESFEDRVRVIASELREARGREDSAQLRCASQKAQAEKWAADLAKKFYAERQILIDELVLARQEIGNLKNNPGAGGHPPEGSSRGAAHRDDFRDCAPGQRRGGYEGVGRRQGGRAHRDVPHDGLSRLVRR